MSRYLVTGCAGFIGSHLSLALLNAGDEVVGVDRISPYYDVRVKHDNISRLEKNSGFQFIETELTLVGENDLRGYDGIFHLAGQAGVRASWGDQFATYLNDNVLSSQFLFEHTDSDCPIVWASSSSVYGDSMEFPLLETMNCEPISPYGITKLCVENLSSAYTKQKNQRISGLRYFTVFGPGQRPDMAFTKICKSLFLQEPFHVYGDGRQIRDFTFVDDVVGATIDVMKKGSSGLYNIAGGAQTSLLEAIHLFERVSGRKLDVRFEAKQSGDVLVTSASTDKIRSEVGWEPKTDLIDGMRSQWKWAEEYFGGDATLGTK
jgi:UDP-glucuronate 4-epimerase